MAGQNNIKRNTTTYEHETTETRNKIQKMEFFIGHILKKDNNNDCNIALSWTPGGRRKIERKTQIFILRRLDEQQIVTLQIFPKI